MSEVKALRGFEYDGSRKRGEVFGVVNKKHLERLIDKKLVVVVGGTPQGGETNAAIELVAGNAADTLAKVKSTKDGELLRQALIVEQTKGDSARKKVLESLQAAIAEIDKVEV
ncbi:hypothetical protein VDP41_06085 [Xanthomonas campestris pv. campestris]|nr:hypothetical protein [Xanthomonas campestris pv. campestris]MEB1146689.1 hypothetical protein [Xanthomonas campestris pv. campestris]MEB1937001.1 hypothetical protein [Xanthomonas campestris pv. campestris]